MISPIKIFKGLILWGAYFEEFHPFSMTTWPGNRAEQIKVLVEKPVAKHKHSSAREKAVRQLDHSSRCHHVDGEMQYEASVMRFGLNTWTDTRLHVMLCCTVEYKYATAYDMA